MNKSLFSPHFLTTRLPSLSTWAEDPRPAFKLLRFYWQRAHQLGTTWNEAQTEEEFIKPVLEKVLDWSFIVQAKSTRGGQISRPDYALFLSDATKNKAYPLQGQDDPFYRHTTVIAEAKRWDRPLSQKSQDNRDQWKVNSNPSHQMVSYLVGTHVSWGILTNGMVWRLYSREVSSTASEYYEIDLRELFGALKLGQEPTSEQLAQFKYWWLFFRRDAFVLDAQGKSFVQHIHEGSITYARAISEKLKEIVFEEVMPEIAGGFVVYRYHQQGVQKETEESLRQIYRASLSLLYKLLFLLYGEARNLLPMQNVGYAYESLTHMARRFAAWREQQHPISRATYATREYEHFQALCHRIDRGDPDLGIPRYDGGLFNQSTPDNQFLETHKLSDYAVATAVDLLVHDKGEPVDYAFISVRNLGAIYEGLLENKLQVEDAATGKVALVNDKGERKASGSYYTPDYIVEYIVQQTLAPILDERQAQFNQHMDQVVALRLQLQRQTAPDQSVNQLRDGLNRAERAAREAFLGIKVCDPAMGSGHFLVNAVDYLTDGIIERMQSYHDGHPDVELAWNPVHALIDRVRREILEEMTHQRIVVNSNQLDDTALLTRLVMKRCVYGVDLNVMAVELAKLSLWLHSFTVGAPLSFLDHHLRWGNSLIGSDVRTVEYSLNTKRKVQKVSKGAQRLAEGRGETARTEVEVQQAGFWSGPFAGLLDLTDTMLQIVQMGDTTLADVQRSAELYRQFQKELTPYKQVLDLWVSQHFGNTFALEFLDLYRNDVLRVLRNGEPVSVQYQQAIEHARALWQEKRFFHWELEFPEVFIDLEQRNWAKNPGFDAVIGNPPYDVLKRDPKNQELNKFIDYIRIVPEFSAVLSRTLNIFHLMMRKSLGITSSNRFVSMIIPLSLLSDQSSAGLRRILFQQSKVIDIQAFPQKDDENDRVFKEAKLSTCIIVTETHSVTDNFWCRVHPGKLIQDDSPVVKIVITNIKRFDSEYLTVPLGNPVETLILERLYSNSRIIPFGKVANISVGEIDMTADRGCVQGAPTKYELLKGAHLQRYLQRIEPKQGPREWVNSVELKNKYGINSPKIQLFKRKRVIFQGITGTDDLRRLKATLIDPGYYLANSLNYVDIIDVHVNESFLLALLNAEFLEWRFRLTSTNNNVNNYEIEALPIPYINFTTPADDRVRYADKGQRLYEQFCTKEDYACMLGFVEHHLNQQSPQTDVIHDLLAFLAEQMIELNKQKQVEMKGFLTWLETQIGAPIDTLNNKSRLQNYLGDYQKCEGELPQADMLAILRQNQRKLTTDISRRDFVEAVTREYTASLSKLRPIKQRLAATDALIDQVVYRLYGVTEEEIALVEGKV